MRKIILLAFTGLCFGSHLSAQDATTAKPQKKDWSKINLSNRANDHFMIQFGYDGWAGKPDSLTTKWYSRFFNFDVMYDIPFKSDKRLSFAGGIGVATSNVFFDKMEMDIVGKTNSNTLVIRNVSDVNHFKKYKLSTNYLEVPLELRFVSDPLHSGKSFKMALGVKVGTMIDAHTKGKDYEDASGNSLYGNKYKQKEKSRKYFTSAKIAPTFRVGWGPITLYAAYQVNLLFKENEGPVARPYSVGLCLAGL